MRQGAGIIEWVAAFEKVGPNFLVRRRPFMDTEFDPHHAFLFLFKTSAKRRVAVPASKPT
jgi:hypothetical protein